MYEHYNLAEPPVHVEPLFGPKHQCSEHCWCHPEVINLVEFLAGFDETLVFVHNVAH